MISVAKSLIRNLLIEKTPGGFRLTGF